MGGVGELFGISCWAYTCFGNPAGDTGELGVVSQLRHLRDTRADVIGILMRKLEGLFWTQS